VGRKKTERGCAALGVEGCNRHASIWHVSTSRRGRGKHGLLVRRISNQRWIGAQGSLQRRNRALRELESEWGACRGTAEWFSGQVPSDRHSIWSQLIVLH
jgi:hypothetical protein